MSAYLNEDKLKTALEKVFEHLQKQGMLPTAMSNNEKETLIENVISDVKKENNGQVPEFNLSAGGLHNAFVKTLANLLVNEYVHSQKPELKLNVSLFFKDLLILKPEEKKKFKDDLAKELELRLTFLNKQSPNPKDAVTISKMAKDLAEIFVNKTEKEAPGLNERTANFGADLIMANAATAANESDNLRSLYAGMNPNVAGGIAIPVTEIHGNLQGFMNITAGLASSLAFMDEQNRYDNGPDYTGEEANVKANRISSSSLVADAVSELVAGKILEPTTPRLER